MLDKFGGTGLDKASALARQSLYVKFDPLVKGPQSPAVPKAVSKLKPTAEAVTESDDLLLMSTPPQSSDRTKHPAARVLEEAVEETGPSTHAHKPKVDRIFDASPVDKNEGETARPDTSVSPPRPAEPMTSPTESDGLDIVQVLKYSQSDVNRMRKEWELDTQARLLQQAKQTDAAKQENQQLKVSLDEMKTIVAEFEKTVSQVIADKENSVTNSKESVTALVQERDQALEDLQSVEAAFSDLHRRYEKSKGAVENFKKNEETLKKCVADYQAKLKAQDQKYHTLKEQAEDKLAVANEEIDKVRKQAQSENARLQAAVRKGDLQRQSMEQTIEQKNREIAELTNICDELIAKVGK